MDSVVFSVVYVADIPDLNNLSPRLPFTDTMPYLSDNLLFSLWSYAFIQKIVQSRAKLWKKDPLARNPREDVAQCSTDSIDIDIVLQFARVSTKRLAVS